jgi:uncharacterized membrane protein
MSKKLRDLTRATRMMIIAPLAILAMVIFTFIGGEVVKLLWNWLAPMLFGLRLITFWQAIGLLALCRILFGGFGMGGGGHRNSRGMRGRTDGRIRERIRERMEDRWEELTPEQRERFRHERHDRGGQTTPLDSNPTT